MRKMKKFALLALCALHCSAFAEEREWISYKKLLDAGYVEKFYAIPAVERDKINLFMTITPVNKNIKPSDINLSLVHAGGRQALPMTAEGRLTLTPNPKWIAEDAKLWTTAPKGEKASLGMGMTSTLPEGLQWSYAAVMGSVQQANQAIKTMAGAMSLFAPKVKLLVFKFAKPAQLRIQAKDGVKLYASDAKGQIKLTPDAALLKENPLMVASERPLEAELDNE